MESATKMLILLVATESILMVSGLSTGAPEAACATMIPQHGVGPQPGKSPYRILMPQMEVKAGEPIEFTISAPASGPLFRGFFIQFVEPGKNVAVGEFNPLSDASLAQPVACGGKPNTAMTHKINNDKAQVKLQWTPPGKGEFVPLVTLVQVQSTFWVKETLLQALRVIDGDEKVSPEDKPGNVTTRNTSTPENPNSGHAATPNLSLLGTVSIAFVMISFATFKSFY